MRRTGVDRVEANSGGRRWPAWLAGAAVGLLTYLVLAVLEFVENPRPGACDWPGLCGRGVVFFVLAVYVTPVLALATGLLAIFRRTRRFAGGLAVGALLGLVAFGGWLLGPWLVAA